jgi:hypothetical protein
MHSFCWKLDDCRLHIRVERNLLSLCETWGLKQLVDKPNRDMNILDIILTTNSEHFTTISIEPPLVCSDHYTVLASFAHARRNTSPAREPARCFSKANYAAIAQYLSTCHWDALFRNCRTVNDYWSVLHLIINQRLCPCALQAINEE